MEVRRPDAGLAPLERYLSVLKCDSLKALECRICERINHAVRSRQGEHLPVKLSACVAQFDIDPNPRFESAVAHGRLAFDDRVGQFVVSLSRRPGSQGGSLRQQLADPFVRRQRFTYAHEVAHRFCYIQADDGTWIRAAERASASSRPYTRLRLLRKLMIHEELLCNSIAGRVLIPDDILSRRVGLLAPGFRADPGIFSANLDELCDEFAVTRDCMLIQIKKTLRRSQNLLGDLVWFLVRTDGASLVPRFATCALPAAIAGVAPVEVYPGEEVTARSEAIAAFVRRALTGSMPDSGPGEWPCVLATKQKTTVHVKLTGHYSVDRYRSIPGGTVLLWGNATLGRPLTNHAQGVLCKENYL